MEEYNFLNEIKDSGNRVIELLNNNDELLFNKNNNSFQITSICLNCKKFHIIEKRYDDEKSKFNILNLNYTEDKFYNCKTLYCQSCRTVFVIPIIEGSVIFDHKYFDMKCLILKMLEKFDELKYKLSNKELRLCFSPNI